MAKAGAPKRGKPLERDLTELAREGRLPSIHGIDEEVAALGAILGRGAQHVLLSGEPGVGKTARIHALARRIALGSAGEGLDGARLLEISLRAFFSRAGKQEDVGEAWSALVERLEALGGVTLVALGEAPLVVNTVLFGPLADSLRSSTLRFVLEADPRGAHALLRGHGGLGDLVHTVAIPEPGPERSRTILGQVAAELESQRGLVIDPGACDLALRLAKKYLLAQFEPGRSIELLRGAVEEAAIVPHHEVARLPAVMIDARQADDALVERIDEGAAFVVIHAEDGFGVVAQKDAFAPGFGMGAHNGMVDGRSRRPLRVGHRRLAVAAVAREVQVVDRAQAGEPRLLARLERVVG